MLVTVHEGTVSQKQDYRSQFFGLILSFVDGLIVAERLASAALREFGWECEFTISFVQPNQKDFLVKAFERLGCRVVVDPFRDFLTVVAPAVMCREAEGVPDDWRHNAKAS